MKKKLIILFSFLLIILGIIFYGRYIETKRLETKEYALIDKNLPDDFDGLKIVHLSDLHYGRIITNKMINRIIKEINLINPDLIIITGDLIDRDAKINEDKIAFLTKSLSKINSKYGKYACLGNHDIDYDLSTIENIYQNSNFKLLVNDYDIVYGKNNSPIFIGGLDSELEGSPDLDKTMSYFTDHEDIAYKIMLIHEPDSTSKILKDYNSVNLILAGHSHNGQVRIPFFGALYTPVGSKKYFDNYYLINDTSLYVSSGVGVSRINFRLFNPPSINFYRLYNK